MITVSFTGSSKKLTKRQQLLIAETIDGLAGPPDMFYSGAAAGADICSAACAMLSFPEARHVALFPTWKAKASDPPKPCRRDRDGISRLTRYAAEHGVNFAWEWADAGVGAEATGLLRRNDILAVNCTHGVAFPETSKELQRSGTWATVRRMRRLERPVRVVPLDGSEPFTLRSA